MTVDPDHTRRWLINAGGAAVLSGAMPIAQSVAQRADAPSPPAGRADDRVSPATITLADYVAKTLDRDLPPEVATRAKLHVLDTLAAMVSGSRLKPGELAARYVDSLGGKPQAIVIGTNFVTSAVNAALANAMSAHADETDDTHPIGPIHLGCAAISAGLATGELADRSGRDLLRAVTLAYDIGARMIDALGIGQRSRRFSPSVLGSTFTAVAAAAAMLRLDQRQVRHAFSYAGQQASGIGYWTRDHEHVEKAFDFAGMGARNGVMAATMVAMGMSGVDDPFSGRENIYTALSDDPQPEKLVAELGTRFDVFGTTLKKWSVGSPLQSVLDSVSALLADPAVRADNIKHVRVEVPTASLRIVDNSPVPDLSLQHLVGMMIADRGATFASVHDVTRMSDPKVLAVRKLVELLGSDELEKAVPVRQAIVRIELSDGRVLNHRTTVVRGTARNPMERGEVEAKALDLTAPVLGTARAHELIVTIGNLEGVEKVMDLRRLLQA